MSDWLAVPIKPTNLRMVESSRHPRNVQRPSITEDLGKDMPTSDSTNSDTGRLAGVHSAIVTGSSSGIGRGIALAFAEAGVGLVVCADLQPRPKILNDAAWKLATEERSWATHEIITTRHGSGRAVFMRCDASLEREEKSVVEEAVVAEEPLAEEKVWGVADLVAETVRRAGRIDV